MHHLLSGQNGDSGSPPGSYAPSTEGVQIRRILVHIGVDWQPPHIFPARGPPLWDEYDAQMDEVVQIEPDWDLAA